MSETLRVTANNDLIMVVRAVGMYLNLDMAASCEEQRPDHGRQSSCGCT
jgi:hypothetical protein